MKLKGRLTTVAMSAAAMVASGILILSAAQLVSTEKDVENATDSIKEEVKEVTADIAAVEKDIVMAEGPELIETQQETEAETSEPETVSAYADKFMVNIEDYLNIRAAADENSEVIGKLYKGSGGTVLERGTEWTKISSGSVEGYAATGYLLFDAEAEAKANEVGRQKVTILEDALRVRKLPSTDAGVWGLTDKGSTYTASKVENGWAEINYDGETGYVSLEYASVELVIGKAVSIEEEMEQIRLEEEKKKQAELEKKRKQEEAAAEEKRVAASSQFVETVKTSAYNVSEEDVYLLSCLVHAEAGWEPYEGKLAVANVVLNRLNSGKYGNSISAVIYAKGQFSVAASGRLATVMAQGPNSESIKAAKEALAGVNNVPSYPNFRSCGVADYSKYNNYTIIGSQVFFN
ncbi:MAG: cell wall hydrolase [Lachnospiraceae bacterium]|nr:cell wall hydrolase [Lachnospiraceae bacterium]